MQMRGPRSARGSIIITHVGGSSSSRNVEADVAHRPYYEDLPNDPNDNNYQFGGNEDVEDDDGDEESVADEQEDSPGSSSKPRGSNKGLQVQENMEGRKRMEISIGKRNKFTSDKPARYITVKFKELVRGPYQHWKDVPQNVRDQIWNRFKMAFTWPEHMEEGIFNAFNISARNTWNGELFQARENAAKNSGSKEPKEWINYPPNWIFNEDWKCLCEFYASDDFKKKSEIGKRNRRSSKNESMSTHTGGSISLDTHEDRWIQEHNGVPPSNLELFLRVHRKNKGNGDFVDIKSKKIMDTYNNILQNKYGESESQDIKWDGDAWAEAIGPPLNGQVYGFGTMSDLGVVLGPKYARNNKRIMREIESQEDMEARIAAQLRLQLMEQFRKEMQNEMMDMFLRYGVQSGGAQTFGNLLQGYQLQTSQCPMSLPFSFPQFNLGGPASHGYLAPSQFPTGQFAPYVSGQPNPSQLLGGLPGSGQGPSSGANNTRNGSDAVDTNGM